MAVGMIGLGAMGHSVAENIMKHGYPMLLYDVRPESMADLVAKGATVAPAIQPLAGNSDPVLIMVNTYDQCKNCLEQVVETKHSGTVIICSTISMEQVQILEKITQGAGVAMLDAPVSGGTAGAREGTLTIMAAGSSEVYSRCLPILRAFGSYPIHVSEVVGHGQALKAVNQLLVGIHMCAAAEAFNLAHQCGLDLSVVYDTITKSAGNSRIFENRGKFFIERNFHTRSTLAIQLKDTNIACQTAEQVGAPALLSSLCRQLFANAVCLFEKTEDSNAVIKLLERWNAKA